MRLIHRRAARRGAATVEAAITLPVFLTLVLGMIDLSIGVARYNTLSQAAQYAAKGIRVNCIAPGSIEFPGGSWEKRKTTQPELYNAVLGSIRFGRLGTPEEIASVALFLACSAASWVTGQTIAVDGGQMLS